MRRLQGYGSDDLAKLCGKETMTMSFSEIEVGRLGGWSFGRLVVWSFGNSGGVGP